MSYILGYFNGTWLSSIQQIDSLCLFGVAGDSIPNTPFEMRHIGMSRCSGHKTRAAMLYCWRCSSSCYSFVHRVVLCSSLVFVLPINNKWRRSKLFPNADEHFINYQVQYFHKCEWTLFIAITSLLFLFVINNNVNLRGHEDENV